ncbi:rRNA maturation RNase YbeY [Neorhodopirellula pilleata]|uniref:Endoribonuclease YbeY n=1 Tax=Neorhodopirellula pilleata TaxID=2714738 RepID=A0A5C6ASJ7_9BACT|nr:rRNA maturation RNase YbeY [Neorhodopirellula pilleata]TWU01952.1 Endoribonuclease YbeY [Neorhodopirellula pilleata]
MTNIETLIDSDAEDPFAAAGIRETDLQSAVIAAAQVGHCDRISVGVRVTMDAAIHQINRQFLQHDYPTDVISFPYDLVPPRVEGELVVSLETAIAQATVAGWSIREELLLYVVHGTLHLVGYDDTTEPLRSEMRLAERTGLASLGIVPPMDEEPARSASAEDRAR